MKWLAAAAVGAMMLVPMTASASQIEYHWGTYDHENSGKYPHVAHEVKGKEAAAVGFTVEDSMSKESGTVSKVVVARWTNKLTEDQEIIVELSTDPTFPDSNDKTRWFKLDADDQYNGEKNARNVTYYFNPGTTFVRAFIYDSEKGEYGPTTEFPVVDRPSPEITSVERVVKAKSVELEINSDGSATGYEIYRKVGNKYKKIAKITDNVFTDKGLTKGETYSYKMRTYSYNTAAARIIYGDWYYTKVATWGAKLEVKATPTAKKNAIKLTWNKVKDADGYEIYRTDTATSKNYYNGFGEFDEEDWSYSEGFDEYDSFANAKLIATIKKAKTTKYTDKKLDAEDGYNYTYTVVAYKNKGGKKDITVQGNASATLGFDFRTLDSTVNADGSVTLSWKRTVGAEGYKIERLMHETEKNADGTDKKGEDGKVIYTNETKWVAVGTLEAAQREYTFPAYAKDDPSGDKGVFRIYAYKGSVKSDAHEVYTKQTTAGDLPGVTSVTAVQTGDRVVTIAWQPVEGATSYTVYRSTSLAGYSRIKGEYYGNGTPIWYPTQEPIKDSEGKVVRVSYAESVNIPKDVTVITDAYSTYLNYSDSKAAEEEANVLNYGPEAGKTYYYYVIANKTTPAVKNADDTIKTPEKTERSNPAAYAKVTLKATTSLKKAKIKSVASSKKGEVKISWKKVENADKYYVYCSTEKKAKNYMCVGSTSKKSLKVQGLESGKTYYFKVVAADTNSADADDLAVKGDKLKYSDAKSVKVK